MRRDADQLGEEIVIPFARDAIDGAARTAGGRQDRDERGLWPRPLDLVGLACREPAPPRHIVRDWLPEGEATLLAGHGAAGKSHEALHTAVCIAAGTPWHGLATERRRVIYVSAEDSADVLHWRLSRITRHLGIDLNELHGWLDLLDASRINAELVVETRDGPVTTAMYEALGRLGGPGTVFVLDGASDLFGASEIVRRHVRYGVRALRRLASADGAVLLVAHVDKQTARSADTSEGYSGSTAWHNSVRARWYLRPDGDEGGRFVLQLAKANHTRAGAEIRLHWDSEAHTFVAAAVPAEGGMVGAIRERNERKALLDAIRAFPAHDYIPASTTGRRTAYHVLAARSEFPASLHGDKAERERFWAHIEALRAMRAVGEDSIRRADGHKTRVLIALSEGNGESANAETAND